MHKIDPSLLSFWLCLSYSSDSLALSMDYVSRSSFSAWVHKSGVNKVGHAIVEYRGCKARGNREL